MALERSPLGGRFWWWLTVASLSRAPVLMSAVAFTSVAALIAEDPDQGGVLAGASVMGMLFGTPIAISVQRRWPPRRLLTVQLIACASCWLAFVFTVAAKAEMVVLVPVALVAGATMAGTAGLVRSMMSDAVSESNQARASTIDALAQDAVIFLAPVAVSVGVTAGAVGAPVAVAVVALLAVISVPVLKPRSRTLEKQRELTTPAPARPVGKWVSWSFLSLGVGLALGAVEAGAVGLAVGLGLSVGSAWLFFFILAGSGAIGAWLDISAMQQRWPGKRLLILLTSLIIGCVLLSFGPTWLTAMIGLVLIGLPTAAVLGLRSHVFDDDAPASRSGGLTLAFAAQSIGFAVGATLLAITGQSWALLIATGVLIASGLLIRGMRRQDKQ
ncbi:hypothetical protein LWF01_02575 [Saxibacter everestensis]|uniref:MFS transporter n=1 Tax=Saxibacter everestensis TaxID=2909229 RepID=A0ABY8QUJ8_9MICO|nr:hypothetical protein LWF01_02575 [Brevibacteriaceae bacterium ZFBP1038]